MGEGFSNSYEFLILGHPRCGTGFMTKVMGKLGYQIGHEVMGRDGTSNWTYAIGDEVCFSWTQHSANCYNFNRIIHCVRDPLKAIPSIAFTETCYNPMKPGKIYVYKSTMFRHKHLKFGNNGDTIFNFAIRSFLGWNELIENKNPDLVVRIENVMDDMKISFPEIECVELPGPSNKRSHPEMKKEQWNSVDPELLQRLEEFCKVHSYPSIIERINLF